MIEKLCNRTKEIKVANVSSSSTSAEEIEEPEKFNVSLKEALEAYQTCYPNQAITSVKVSQTVGPYYYEITGRDATKECSVRISTKTANIKKKKYIAYETNTNKPLPSNPQICSISKT